MVRNAEDEGIPPAPSERGSAADRAAGGAYGLLEGWMSRDDLARELDMSADTLSRWETHRLGPPCIRVGRKVLYRRGAVEDWLTAQEARAQRSRSERAR